MYIVDFDKLSEMFWDGNYMEIHKDDIPSIPSAFEGMTNGEVIKALFPNIKLIEKVYTTRKYALMDKSVKALLFLKTTDRWWDSPYKGEREDEK